MISQGVVVRFLSTDSLLSVTICHKLKPCLPTINMKTDNDATVLLNIFEISQSYHNVFLFLNDKANNTDFLKTRMLMHASNIQHSVKKAIDIEMIKFAFFTC